jgi:dihydrofolate reductase
MRITVVNHLTLDGVMQAPGRPDEDTRDGFPHGGWATARTDEVMQQALGERLGRPNRGWLFGRRTYEDLLASWNLKGGPYRDALNDAPKYVAASDPATTLAWPNSTLLHGDVVGAVAQLKESADGDVVIMGSGELIRSLAPTGLIDEYLLMIHPVVLGTGRRLFDRDDRVIALRLVGCTATTTGVMLASYTSLSPGTAAP